ncbi:MAG: VWA domain-containing protein [Gemmatimonadota bacterium]
MPTFPDSPTSASAASPTISVQSDRTLVRSAARSTRYALITIVAPTVTRTATRIPVNLAIVLDRSGSMAGDKFVLARRAVEQALAQLQPDDRFALVVFDDSIDLLAESTFATPDAKRNALARLAGTEPRGSTDLAGGWMRGCEQVALSAATRIDDHARVIDRCLLLTDGLANRGITDRAVLIGHATALHERGIQTTTFGVGSDFDELLLAGLADAGGGHFYYLERPEQIPELIASEVGEALEVVMRNAVVEVKLPPGVTGHALSLLRSRSRKSESGRVTLSVHPGDLVSGQELEVMIRLSFPTGSDGETIDTELSFGDESDSSHVASAHLQFTYASHAENDRQPRNRVVDRRVAMLFAARARREAVEHQRTHDYDRARGVLVATANRISGYAGGDSELLAIISELQSDVLSHTNAPMQALEMKKRHFDAYNAERSRAASGKAKKWP